MEARIIGLKGCGKTTLIASLAEGRGEGHIATVHVGDPRVRTLSEIFQPKKTTFAEFKVQEVAWPEASARKGEMERYLDALAGGQLYVHVLRAFDSTSLGDPAHPEADLEELDREFILADLIRIERAFERAKKAPLPDSGKKALARCQEALEVELPYGRRTGRGAALVHSGLPVPHPHAPIAGGQHESEGNSSGAGWDASALAKQARGRHVVAFPFPDALEVARLSADEQRNTRRP